MNLLELISKLNGLQKDGWSWSIGHAHGDFYARLWKNKDGVIKISRTARQGRHVISELGNNLEDALTKVLSRYEKGTFDADPTKTPLLLRALRKTKKKATGDHEKPNSPDPPIPEAPKD